MQSSNKETPESLAAVRRKIETGKFKVDVYIKLLERRIKGCESEMKERQQMGLIPDPKIMDRLNLLRGELAQVKEKYGRMR